MGLRMGTRFWRGWVAVLVFCAAWTVGGRGLYGQTRSELPRITDIQVRGLQRIKPDQVFSAIKLRVGDVAGPEAINEDVRRVEQLGYFSPLSIQVSQEPYENGVRLIFGVAERPVLTSLTFTGNRAFSDAKLRSTLGMSQGSFVDVGLLRISSSRIEDLYHEQGYQFVEVERKEQEDKEASTISVAFVVKEGPKTVLEKVVFRGNRTFSAGKLREVTSTRARFMLWGGVFDRRAFELDLDHVTEFYKEAGFLDAVVSGDLQYSPDKTSLTAVVEVVEGTRYTVAGVTIRGEEAFAGEQLYPVLKMHKGSDYTWKAYSADYDALRGFYGDRGYIDARIQRRELFPEPGQVEIVYEIAENGPLRLGRIDIRGNVKTKDKVIRRVFNIYPGDLVNISRIRHAVTRLRELNYFTKVETTFAEGPEPDTRNLVVDVEEGPTGQVLFGAGVSSSAGLIGQFELSLRNFDIADWPRSLDDLFSGNAFVGAGQTFILQLRPGTESNQARVFFSEPYLFDSPYSLSTDLFYYERDREDYDEARAGARVGVGRRFTEDFSVQLTARVESIKIGSVEDDAPSEFLALEGRHEINSLALGADYDKTDSVWLPSTGYRALGTVEVADKAFGSDFSFVKVIGEGRYYRTIHTTRDGLKHIAMIRARAGAVDRTHGPDVPFFERFYAGGRDSIRGFAYRGVGPHEGGDPIGGEWMGVANLEYTFPIYEDTVRGVFFVDTGTVGRDLDELSARVRAGAGFGLRIRLPGFDIPIALDFAAPINAGPDDDTEILSFAIGTIY